MIEMNKKSNEFIRRYKEKRQLNPERQPDYCVLCKKLREVWEDTIDPDHIQIHILLQIKLRGGSNSIRNPDFRRWSMQAGGLG